MSDNLQPHIRLDSSIGTKYAILPGDPKRVDRVGTFLENVKEIEFNREYKSIVGEYKGVKTLVMSTGMGGPSMAIAIEELRNIGIEYSIRIGSCGGLKKHTHLGDLIIPTGIVRNEGTSDSYVERGYPAIPDMDLLFSIIKTVERLGYKYEKGKVRCHDSFYVDNESEINAFWAKKDIIGSEMESAAMFVIGGLRNMKVATILNVVVDEGGNLENGINSFVENGNLTHQGEKNEIITALETLSNLKEVFVYE